VFIRECVLLLLFLGSVYPVTEHKVSVTKTSTVNSLCSRQYTIYYIYVCVKTSVKNSSIKESENLGSLNFFKWKFYCIFILVITNEQIIG